MKPIAVSMLTTILKIESSKLFTGTQELLNDASKALLVITPIIATLVLVYCGLRKMNADEHEAPKWKSRMIAILVILIIVVSASGIIALVTSYYQ